MYLWPKITDVESSKKAAKQGILVFVFCIVVTSVALIMSYFQNKAVLGMNSYALVDLVLFVIIAFGMYKMSRLAAVCGLILYVIERIVTVNNMNGVSFIVMFVLIMMLINCIRGTFAYHDFMVVEQAETVIAEKLPEE